VFVADPEFNLVGEHLGEEEWRITSWETSVSQGGVRDKHSQFNFLMHAERHMMYYVVRIFVPLGLLIAVAWVTFFLRDYSKRVDVSAGNLLAFIAFNFTLGSDLPRLGYLTFLDELMVVAFAFAALTVIYNVIMRRLEASGNHVFIERVDATLLLWGYPLLYLVSVWILLQLNS
jgi:ABC-type multidrug transport system fused ATPase/permease subunit